MNKILLSIMLAVFLCLFASQGLLAQFLNLQIKIEPELSTSVDQELNFGVLSSNVGEVAIALGDLNMGIFRIRAYKTQNIFISLNHPDALIREGYEDGDEIPMELFIAYNYDANEDYLNAIELPGNEGYLPISENRFTGLNNNSVDNWKELLIFLYGNLEINNIAEGEYSALATLVIDYD